MTTARRTGRKRAAGEGTIRQRPNGLWEGQRLLPSGKRASVYGKTQREVKAKLRALQDTLTQGVEPEAGRQTISRYLTYWLAEIVQHECAEKTHRDYTQIVSNHLLPGLGKLRLDELSAQQVQALLNQKRRQGLSPRTVQYIHAVLRRALNDAVRARILTWNPALAYKPPRVARRRVEAITAVHARAIVTAFAGHPLELPVMAAILLGLRQGEVLGLRWPDFDLDGEVVRVRNQVKRTRGALAVGELKTEPSFRSLALPPLLTGRLRDHRGRQQSDRARLGPEWNPLDLVFPSVAGTPLNGTNVTHRFQQQLATAGLARMTFHDLRHAAATLALSEGASLVEIKEFLGHSQIAITADIYAHVAPELRREMARRMQRALDGEAADCGTDCGTE